MGLLAPSHAEAMPKLLEPGAFYEKAKEDSQDTSFLKMLVPTAFCCCWPLVICEQTRPSWGCDPGGRVATETLAEVASRPRSWWPGCRTSFLDPRIVNTLAWLAPLPWQRRQWLDRWSSLLRSQPVRVVRRYHQRDNFCVPCLYHMCKWYDISFLFLFQVA